MRSLHCMAPGAATDVPKHATEAPLSFFYCTCLKHKHPSPRTFSDQHHKVPSHSRSRTEPTLAAAAIHAGFVLVPDAVSTVRVNCNMRQDTSQIAERATTGRASAGGAGATTHLPTNEFPRYGGFNPPHGSVLPAGGSPLGIQPCCASPAATYTCTGCWRNEQ